MIVNPSDIYDSKVPHQRQIELVWSAESFFMMCVRNSLINIVRERARASFFVIVKHSKNCVCVCVCLRALLIFWKCHTFHSSWNVCHSFEQISVIFLHQTDNIVSFTWYAKRQACDLLLSLSLVFFSRSSSCYFISIILFHKSHISTNSNSHSAILCVVAVWFTDEFEESPYNQFRCEQEKEKKIRAWSTCSDLDLERPERAHTHTQRVRKKSNRSNKALVRCAVVQRRQCWADCDWGVENAISI